MKKLAIILGVSLFINLVLVGFAFTLSERPEPEHLTGTIENISQTGIMVRTDDGVRTGAVALSDSVFPRPRPGDTVALTYFEEPNVILVTASRD